MLSANHQTARFINQQYLKKKKKKKKKSLILYARWYKFMKMKSWMGKNKFVNGGNLLHADSDAVSFGCTDVLLCIFDF